LRDAGRIAQPARPIARITKGGIALPVGSLAARCATVADDIATVKPAMAHSVAACATIDSRQS
jgi:hypothetical protein